MPSASFLAARGAAADGARCSLLTARALRWRAEHRLLVARHLTRLYAVVELRACGGRGRGLVSEQERSGVSGKVKLRRAAVASNEKRQRQFPQWNEARR